MRSLLRFVLLTLVVSASAAVPLFASAHEAYVLHHAVFVREIAEQSPNPFLAIQGNEFRFAFWGVIAFLVVVSIFCISLFHKYEIMMLPLYRRLRRFAQPIARITLGLCLLACAYYGGLFGPELPLRDMAGDYDWLLRDALYACGTLVVLGLYTRLGALGALAIFGWATLKEGTYILTYTNYLGEILLTLILGGGALSLGGKKLPKSKRWQKLIKRFEPYSFLIMRVGFGVAVMYAAFYAKFLHSNLALQTIHDYQLTNYFHFDPLFIVLGAFILEMILGLFIILGIELRWTAIFFLFWLGLSLLYFGESVWPHLVLLGLNLVVLFHGYDKYTVECFLFKRHRREMVA